MYADLHVMEGKLKQLLAEMAADKAAAAAAAAADTRPTADIAATAEPGEAVVAVEGGVCCHIASNTNGRSTSCQVIPGVGGRCRH
jgi:hypothetical protein